jgi:hypothetical protein
MGKRAGATVVDRIREELEQRSGERTAAVVDKGKRAADLAQEAAGPVLRSAAEHLTAAAIRGAEIASAAEKAAEPRVISAAATAAETLSDAAERAAGALAETAERLSHAGTDHGAVPFEASRERLADKLIETASKVRPPQRSHRARNFFLVTALAGAGTAIIIRTNLVAKVKGLFGGQGQGTADGAITLPEDAPISARDGGIGAGEVAGAPAGANGAERVPAPTQPR